MVVAGLSGRRVERIRVVLLQDKSFRPPVALAHRGRVAHRVTGEFVQIILDVGAVVGRRLPAIRRVAGIEPVRRLPFIGHAVVVGILSRDSVLHGGKAPHS